VLFLLKTGFWSSYCQISTDLDKILHTIVVRSTLVGRLTLRSARWRLQAKRKQLCFCNRILVTHPKCDGHRRRIAAITAANRQRGGEDGCYHEKFRNFIAWAEPYPKQHFFAFYGTLRLSCAQPTGNSFTLTNGTDGKLRL